jgi:hypothetical protein
MKKKLKQKQNSYYKMNKSGATTIVVAFFMIVNIDNTLIST